MNPLNIVFAGTPEFGVPCLNVLLHSPHQLSAIYTQPDRPAGRGRTMQASAIKEWAQEHSVPVYQPVNFKSPEALDELAALKPDLLIVIAYGLILPRAVLDIPRLGCVNVHASLLPFWRGASPIQQAILHGDAQSGVTIMQMDVGMDTGAMFTKVTCPITSLDTAGTLHDKLAHLSVEPLMRVVDLLAQGLCFATEQDSSLATYAKKINKEDGWINWQNAAQTIDYQIRAFNPWPVAFTAIGEQVLRIHQASPVFIEDSKVVPGTVLRLDKKGMLVATGKGALLVEKIQFPGAKAVAIADWLNSGKTQLHVGLVLQ